MHLPPSGSTSAAPGLPGQRTGPAARGGGGTVREQLAIDVFTDLTAAVVGGEDVIELLERLTGRCVELFDVASAGMVLADGRGALHVLAASSPDAHDLEVLQVQRADGPCQDCYRTGRQVLVGDLTGQALRWPHFVPAALAAGFTSVHAVPVRLRSRTLGALGLFGGGTGTLSDRDLSLAQALADVASAALTRDRGRDDDVTARLQDVLGGRVVLEQAEGYLAHRGDLDVAQASTALRRFARARDLELSDVARAVVTQALPAAALLEDVDARS